jgi:hypothetical protein
MKTGDWVEVKSVREIADTLDENGTLDGLPFMPEMAPYCGRRFQVLRIAEKTCVEYPGGGYKIREFRQNDVVILDQLRCSGRDHEGCGRACILFWKTEWLRPKEGPARHDVSPHSHEGLISRIQRVLPSGRYFCQATELATATQPLSRAGLIRKCLAEVRNGSRGVFEMMGLMLTPMWRKTLQAIRRRRLAGPLKTTPVEALNLKPGEWVQIKSVDEIARTLDAKGRNRGLLCDYGMCKYSGGRYRVRNRLERMIAEPTGQMRHVPNTVILDGLHCLCSNVFGGCPRNDFMYWREIWLERVAPEPEAQQGCTSPEDSSCGASLV